MSDDVRDDGDHHLCSIEMHLWGIVYTVAMQWATFVIFRWDRMSVPDRIDGLISFFVPRDATHRYEICEFIEGHLKHLRREAIESEKFTYFPGVQATVYTFSGVRPEISAEISDAMRKEWVKGLKMDLGSPKRWIRVAEQARQRLADDSEFADKLIGSMLPSQLERLMEGGGVS